MPPRNVTTRTTMSPEGLSTVKQQNCSDDPTMRRNVSFGNVDVREYEQTMGDQPCVSGPPLALGWKFEDECTTDVEDYEADREGLRREGQEMKMPPSVRVQKLLDSGHTRHQINEGAITSRKSMKQRMRTANETETMHLASTALESLGRKIKRAVGRGKGSKEDQLLWRTERKPSSHSADFRKSCPELRRVQSTSDVPARRSESLGASGGPLRGILKTSPAKGKSDVVSDGTEEESDSDTSPSVLPRIASMNHEKIIPENLERPVEDATMEEDRSAPTGPARNLPHAVSDCGALEQSDSETTPDVEVSRSAKMNNEKTTPENVEKPDKDASKAEDQPSPTASDENDEDGVFF